MKLCTKLLLNELKLVRTRKRKERMIVFGVKFRMKGATIYRNGGGQNRKKNINGDFRFGSYNSLNSEEIISPGRSGIVMKLTGWAHSVLFVFVVGCFLYGLVSSVLGKTPYLTLVAEAAGRQLE
ncbi:hypothetical protein RD792_003661 [Penstemon davidsonii]|uniref:Protein TIC 20 n=1 Tax=Penstemon davidsonii TaxID=160366 RepID=A0ABR0DFA6_9LAMI|nr:hypothetical protein RD792_003661 [Penstemon davidsonii]